jgi:XRE family transcriptional regulator, aerobic/anaerobic benzoate catabolism transcriptional regulator
MPVTKPSRRAVPRNRAYAEADTVNQTFLTALGSRIRNLRATRGITRKMLAEQSGVSERFLAELETGSGNASVLLLRHLARALDVPVTSLIAEANEVPVGLAHTTELLRRLAPNELQDVQQWLLKRFGESQSEARRERIALIGLRGAGKSTLGAALAKKLDVPFFELDRLIEKASGVPLAAMFDLYGQSGYRRFERTCLDDLLAHENRFVLATGGSIVSESATFKRLLGSCYTVWLRATPEDHMKRVIAQGDMRPMSQSSEAMADLKRILAEREPLYAKADLTIDTSDASLASGLTVVGKQLHL